MNDALRSAIWADLLEQVQLRVELLRRDEPVWVVLGRGYVYGQSAATSSPQQRYASHAEHSPAHHDSTHP